MKHLKSVRQEDKLREAVLMLAEIVRQIIVEQATRELSGTTWANEKMGVILEINSELQKLNRR